MLAGWCMVVTTKSMVETTHVETVSKTQLPFHGYHQVAACLEQPTNICLGTTMFLGYNMVGISIWDGDGP